MAVGRLAPREETDLVPGLRSVTALLSERGAGAGLVLWAMYAAGSPRFVGTKCANNPPFLQILSQAQPSPAC